MEAQDILDRAYRLLMENEIARGHYATDADGERVLTDSEDAAAFCAAGAIFRAAYDLGLTPVLHNSLYQEAFSRFHDFVSCHYMISSLHEWSDRTSDGEIREMFRRISNPLVEVAI